MLFISEAYLRAISDEKRRHFQRTHLMPGYHPDTHDKLAIPDTERYAGTYVLGVQGCLHPDTPIFDPVDGTTHTVFERYHEGRPFHVFALDGPNIVVAQADAPLRYSKAPMYEVSDGVHRIKVTAQHRLWDGAQYVECHVLYSRQWSSGVQLPTIADSDLVALQDDGQAHPVYVHAQPSAYQITRIEDEVYYDFHVPRYENYYACGLFHHNTGKSGLLENMIGYDTEVGNGVIVVDPHGDLITHVIGQLPPERLKKTYLLDMEDEAWPFGVNLFSVGELSTEVARTQAVERLMHIFEVLWPEVMSQQHLPRYLRCLTLALLANPDSTLLDMYHFLLDSTIRQRMLKQVADAMLRQFWLHYDTLSDAEQFKRVQPLLNRLESLFVGRSLVRNIVGQRKTTIDFRKAMEDRQILLIRLPIKTVKQDARLIGTVIVSQLHAAIFSFGDVPQAQRPGVSVYIDECFERGTPVLTPTGYKPIEDIQVGDMVMTAFGPQPVLKTFHRTTSQLYRVKLSNGETLRVTGNHPVFTTEGWKRVKDLHINAEVLHYLAVSNIVSSHGMCQLREDEETPIAQNLFQVLCQEASPSAQYDQTEGKRSQEGSYSEGIRVESIEVQEQTGDDKSSGGFDVYNLHVAGHPSYVVGDVLVHNCQHFTTPDFAELFTESRKYGMKLTLAHQYRNQLPSYLQDATMSARTKFCFQCTPEDAREMAHVFPPQEERVTPDAIEPQPVKHLLTYGSDDPYIQQFTTTYLRPLQSHKRGNRVEIDVYRYDWINNEPLDKPRVADPTPYLDNLLYEVMRSGNADVPIPADAVIGLANCGRGFFSLARGLSNGHRLLQPQFQFPAALVVPSGDSYRWSRPPEDAMEQLYHCLFFLRMTMHQLAADPIGKKSAPSTTAVAQMLSSLPRRVAFVHSGSTSGVIYTDTTPASVSARDFSSRMQAIREQTHARYCQPRATVEASFAPVASIEPDNQPDHDDPIVSLDRWEEA